jgi:hypothetical protein
VADFAAGAVLQHAAADILGLLAHEVGLVGLDISEAVAYENFGRLLRHRSRTEVFFGKNRTAYYSAVSGFPEADCLQVGRK